MLQLMLPKSSSTILFFVRNVSSFVPPHPSILGCHGHASTPVLALSSTTAAAAAAAAAQQPSKAPHDRPPPPFVKPSSEISERRGRIPPVFFGPGVEMEVEGKEIMEVLPWSNIVVGPYAGHSQVKEVEFVKSSGRAKDCPKDDRPEFAFLGRSNVGKSSLINSLARRDVALTSKKPGKTQTINHFLVNRSWYIVDLPGYGFAKVPEGTRMDWSSFTKGYFLNRVTLVSVLLLVDASISPQKIDLDCANWLGRNDIPITFVFTKCDKKKTGKKRPQENIEEFQEIIKSSYRETPPWIMTSSLTGLGRDELLLHMSQLRNYWDN